jgi:hypothetical protein
MRKVGRNWENLKGIGKSLKESGKVERNSHFLSTF